MVRGAGRDPHTSLHHAINAKTLILIVTAILLIGCACGRGSSDDQGAAGPLALSKSQVLDAFADNITAKAENHRFD